VEAGPGEAGWQVTVKGTKVEVMTVTNPQWEGKILVEALDKDGNRDLDLSSTRQTRDNAYQYLLAVSGLDKVITKATTKPAKRTA
jgi:hypothetical protein